MTYAEVVHKFEEYAGSVEDCIVTVQQRMDGQLLLLLLLMLLMLLLMVLLFCFCSVLTATQ